MNRRAPVTQANATRYFKAAAAAGFGTVRLVMHPDGRNEVIAEATKTVANETPLQMWMRENGQS